MTGLPSREGNLKIEILIHITVEIDLALLDELHHGSPRDELRHRPRTEQSQFRVDRRALLDVRVAIAARRRDLSVLDDGSDRTRDVTGVQGIREIAVEPAVQIFRRQCHAGGCVLEGCGIGAGWGLGDGCWRARNSRFDPVQGRARSADTDLRQAGAALDCWLSISAFRSCSPTPSARSNSRHRSPEHRAHRRCRAREYQELRLLLSVSGAAKKRMIPILTRIRAKSAGRFGALVHHSGEEYIYVLKGGIKVITRVLRSRCSERGRIDLYRQQHGTRLRHRRRLH